jgi:hypothetical protein
MSRRILIALLLFAATAAHADVRVPYLKVSLTPSQTVTVADIDSVGDVDDLCVVYVSLDEVLNGEPYAPRHCVAFDAGSTRSYVDDWDFVPSGHSYDVHAELYAEGRDETVLTNVVRVVRQ